MAAERLEKARADREAGRQRAEEKQHALQVLRDDERALEKAGDDIRRTLDRAINRRELIEEELARTSEHLENLRRSMAELQRRSKAADDERRIAQQAVADAREALETASAEHDDLQDRLEDATNRVRGFERRRDALKAEIHLLESMLTSYEDFSGAVQYLASADWSADHLTTVSDVLACEDEHRLALDAALGEYASYVVVKNEAEARQAIELLRRDDQGRATFIVLDRLRAVAAPSKTVGARPLRDLVRTEDPIYDNLASLLLRGAYFVDTLDRAEGLAASARGDARYFTASGEWVDAGGIVHAGSEKDDPSAAGSRLGRREQLESARSELGELDRQIEEACAETSRIRTSIENLRLEELRHGLSEAERRLTDVEKAADRAAFELQTSNEREAELRQKVSQSKDDIESISQEAANSESELLQVSEHRCGRWGGLLRSCVHGVRCRSRVRGGRIRRPPHCRRLQRGKYRSDRG